MATAGQADANAMAGPHPEALQHAPDAVGLGRQFLVAELAFVGHDGGGRWRALRLV